MTHIPLTEHEHEEHTATAMAGGWAHRSASRRLSEPGQAVAALAVRLLQEDRPGRVRSAVLQTLCRLFPQAPAALLEPGAGRSLAVSVSTGMNAALEEQVEAACAAQGPLPAGEVRDLGFAASSAGTDRRLWTVAVPREGQPGGCLAVMGRAAEPPRPEDLVALRAIGAIAALALDNAAAKARGERRAKRLRALHQIGVAVSRVLDPDALYEVVHRETARVLKVDAFYVALWDAEQGIIHYPYSVDRGKSEMVEDGYLTDGPCSWVIRNRRPFVAGEESRSIQDAGKQFGTAAVSLSALHVPMLLGDRVVGVMSAQSYEANAYSEEDLHLFQMVAGQTAVAVENARLYRAVQALSFTDDLTGLPNRRALVRRLEDELAQSASCDVPFSALMLDLDHFKRVNDTYGHGAGDTVLREVAALLRGALRRQDVVGRWGGEEFLVLLPGADAAGAARVAEALRAAVAAHHFEDARIPQPQTITIGGLSLAGRVAATSHRLLEGVDTLLYRAKAAGRNRAHLEHWDAVIPDACPRSS